MFLPHLFLLFPSFFGCRLNVLLLLLRSVCLMHTVKNASSVAKNTKSCSDRFFHASMSSYVPPISISDQC